MTPDAAKRLFVRAILMAALAVASVPALGQTILHDSDQAANASDPTADQPKVVTDIAAWQHPTKAVFAKYKMVLTKIVLTHDRKYPTFHVVDFHADPRSGMTNAFFNKLNLALLEANGYNAFTIVEDDFHDGYKIGYDKKTRTMSSDLVLDCQD